MSLINSSLHNSVCYEALLNVDCNSIQSLYVDKTPGVMIWDAMCTGNRSSPVFIPGTLSARRYIDHLLEPMLLSYLVYQ